MEYMHRGRENVSSLTASVGFTSTYLPATDTKVRFAVIQAIEGNIRFRVDGSAPTSSAGMRLLKDSSVEIWGARDMTNFRCIDDGGTANLEVNYYGEGG